MKRLHLIFLVLLVTLTTGCITRKYGFSYEQLSRLDKGMRKQEVVAVLGNPVYRDLKKQGEVWIFRSLGTTGWSVVEILFKNGRLSEMKSYLEKECNHDAPIQKGSSFSTQETSDDTSGTKIIIGPDGRPFLKAGPLVVTPDGDHVFVH